MVAVAPNVASLIDRTLGNYEVRQLLGRGATSTVYLARHIPLDRPVALKVLLGSVAREPDRLRQFAMEARATATLQHPNIVRIYEAGVRDGIPFIAMEYIEGETLERFLLRQGRLPWQHALQLGQQVALALEAAHAAGIIHRDIKPSNILLDRQGQIRLTDFGIACTQGNEGDAFAGTPEYMSPEQCNGEMAGASSDLFSLGVLLYRLMAGEMPFRGESAEGLARSVISETPRRLNQLLPDVPDDVARLVAHLLEKSPAARPPAARAVVERVQRIQREKGGASALPEALNAFIREQSKPDTWRQLPSDPYPTPGASARMLYTPISFWARASACALCLLALTGAAWWHFLREDSSTAALAATLPASLITAHEATGFTVDLPHHDWRIDSMRWLGSEPVLLLSLVGRSGSGFHESGGVLAIDTSTREVINILAPSGPLTHAGFNGAGRQPRMPHLPVEGYLKHRIPGIVAQQSGAGLKYTLRLDAWQGQGLMRELEFGTFASAAPAYLHPPVSLAFSPSGARLAMLAPGATEVLEYDFAADEISPVRLPERTRLLPDSLQFTADGKTLLCVATGESGKQVLWKLGSEPVALVRGDLQPDFAVQPQGEYLAVTEGHDLLLLDAETGTRSATLEDHYVGSEAWNPEGDSLYGIYSGPAATNAELRSITATQQMSTKVLVTLQTTDVLPPAVSRTGEWLAFGESIGGRERIRFLRLNRIVDTSRV